MTIATAIRIGNPASWTQAEAARDDSGGLIDAVTDRQILEAYRLLARSEAVFVEPASAASVAGLLMTAKDGRLPAGSTVVCTVTGNGLKDPEWAISGAPKPITVPVDAHAAASKLGPGMTFRSNPVHVRVPATSANLGPGFDALGLALGLYDDVSASVTDGGLSIDVDGEGAGLVAQDETHLVVQAMRAGFDGTGWAAAGAEAERPQPDPARPRPGFFRGGDRGRRVAGPRTDRQDADLSDERRAVARRADRGPPRQCRGLSARRPDRGLERIGRGRTARCA